MSTTKAGGRSKPGMPDDYWRKSYEMRADEIDRLRALLAPIEALDWPCDTCKGKGEMMIAVDPDATEWWMNARRGPCPAGCVNGQVPLAERVRLLIALWLAANNGEIARAIDLRLMDVVDVVDERHCHSVVNQVLDAFCERRPS